MPLRIYFLAVSCTVLLRSLSPNGQNWIYSYSSRDEQERVGACNIRSWIKEVSAKPDRNLVKKPPFKLNILDSIKIYRCEKDDIEMVKLVYCF